METNGEQQGRVWSCNNGIAGLGGSGRLLFPSIGWLVNIVSRLLEGGERHAIGSPQPSLSLAAESTELSREGVSSSSSLSDGFETEGVFDVSSAVALLRSNSLCPIQSCQRRLWSERT